MSWGPIIHRDLFRFPAEDTYTLAAPRYSPRWLWRGAWRRLAGYPPGRLRPSAILRGRGAALIHAHYGPVGWWALPLRRALGLPLVTTFYGYDLAPRIAGESPWWPGRRRRLFTEGDLFLVEGPHMRERLIRLGCPAGKVEIQPILLPLHVLPLPRPRPPGDPVVLLFAGRFVEKKGLPYALEAVAGLLREGRRLEFRIVGDGPLGPAVRRTIRKLGIEGAVRLLGFLDHDRYLAELGRADLFIHPSVTTRDGDTEGGAPTTILEAQAMGLPVVATRHADIPHVVRSGESALLVGERDTPALVEALRALLDHPERWPVMGRVGRAHVEAHHDVAREVGRLEDRYAALLERAVPHAAGPGR